MDNVLKIPSRRLPRHEVREFIASKSNDKVVSLERQRSLPAAHEAILSQARIVAEQADLVTALALLSEVADELRLEAKKNG